MYRALAWLLHTFRAKLVCALHIRASRIVRDHRISEAPCAIGAGEPDRGNSLLEGCERRAAAQAEECY